MEERSIHMLTGSVSNTVIVEETNEKDMNEREAFQKDGEKDVVKKIKSESKNSSKRGIRRKLSKEEEREMKRTCSNVFVWLKPTRQIPVVDR